MGKPPPPPELPKFLDFDGIMGNPHCYTPSQPFDLGRYEIPNRRIVFVNGIGNSFQDSYNHAEYTSKLGQGVNVHGIFNATNGIRNDIYQSCLGLQYQCTNPEKLLYDEISNYFANAGPNATMLIVAFSQGGIITRNTLHFYPNEEHKKRIFVLAIAPGAYTDSRNCNTVKHYVHPDDPVPTLDKYGAKMHAHTIFPVANKVPNSFKTHHAYQDPIYKDVIENNINYYLESGCLIK